MTSRVDSFRNSIGMSGKHRATWREGNTRHGHDESEYYEADMIDSMMKAESAQWAILYPS